MNNNIEKILKASGCRYWRDIPLSLFTSLRIGGNADYLVRAETATHLELILGKLIAIEAPYYILGEGQNTLASDSGFRGVVIKNEAKGISVKPTSKETALVEVESGTLFSTLCVETALKFDLQGLEWGLYIPGTVGGAVVNNADSYGHSIAETLTRLQVLSRDGSTTWIEKGEFDFGRRESRFSHTSDQIILKSQFELQSAEHETLRAAIEGFKRGWRPEQPNAGVVLQAEGQLSLAQLIDKAGLKSARVGDAAISPQHPAWLINMGAASATDYIALLRLVASTVLEICQVKLKPLVKYIPEDGEQKALSLY